MVNKEKARRKSKAISPIIATLILIVITVIAGVMLYGFVTGFMAKTTSSTGAIATISIDSAGVSSKGSANVVVTNIGNSPVTITQVNLLDPSTNALIASSKSPSTSSTITIPGGKTVTITASGFTLASSVKSFPSQGTTVLVQVVTSTGAYSEISTVVGP
jgi:flagellin-like protein